MTTNKSIVQRYGELLLEEYNLQLARKEFTFDFIISNENILQFLEDNLHFAKEELKNVEIIHKSIGEDGLKWHIDDCQIVKFKNGPTYNLQNYIFLEGTSYLYIPEKKPKKTILFYTSTFGIDFTGGILTFADSVKIRPKKNHGIMIDSREAHYVTPTKGNRTVTVVKVY